MLSTSIGLLPVVALFATALGGAVGFFGRFLGRWRSGPIPGATRPNKPLQPTSGDDKSSPIRRTARAARG